MINPDDGNYYLKQFKVICVEIELSPAKVLQSPPPILGSLIRQWMIGEIDEKVVKGCMENLSILNGGAWR